MEKGRNIRQGHDPEHDPSVSQYAVNLTPINTRQALQPFHYLRIPRDPTSVPSDWECPQRSSDFFVFQALPGNAVQTLPSSEIRRPESHWFEGVLTLSPIREIAGDLRRALGSHEEDRCCTERQCFKKDSSTIPISTVPDRHSGSQISLLTTEKCQALPVSEH